MATLTDRAAVTPSSAPLRPGGWFLIATLLSFIAVLVYIGVVGADYNAQLQAAAKAANTTIPRIPAEEQARIAVRYPVFSIVSGLLLLIPFALLAVALHRVQDALRATEGEWLVRASWWLGLGALLVWGFFDLLSFGLLAGPDRLPPLVNQLDHLFAPLVSAAAGLGLGAVLCAALAAWRAGVARRTALGAAIVAGLLLVIDIAVAVGSGFTAEGMPPIAPMLPALILGIGLVRSKAAYSTAAH